MSTSPTQLLPTQVITDTNVLINFIHLNELALLGALKTHRIVAPEEVIGEITRAEQARMLQDSIDAGDILACGFSDPEALAIFDRLCHRIQIGEAACIAIAYCGGHCVATDEKRRPQRLARRLLGTHRLLRTEGVMGLCIRSGLITIAEADQFKAELETKRYKMDFKTFAELLAA